MFKFLTQAFVFVFSICFCSTLAQDSARNHKGLFILSLLNKCNCRCGHPNRQGRILGGEITKQYEFPWLSYIQVRNKQTIIPATLINDRYVITSASLLVGLTPYDIKILLGVQDGCNPDVSSTIFSAESIKIHQLYSSLSRAHDIALVGVNGKISFDRRVSPICLPPGGRSYLGEVATITGWARDDKLDSLSNCRPLKLGLPVLGEEECVDTSPDRTFYSGDKGCAGVVGASSPICKDDAGGPIMFRDRSGIYEIIGILSDKNACGNPPSTAMFTKLPEHLGWIKENTLDGCYCVKI